MRSLMLIGMIAVSAGDARADSADDEGPPADRELVPAGEAWFCFVATSPDGEWERSSCSRHKRRCEREREEAREMQLFEEGDPRVSACRRQPCAAVITLYVVTDDVYKSLSSRSFAHCLALRETAVSNPEHFDHVSRCEAIGEMASPEE